MTLYRSTINMGGLPMGKTVDLDPHDPKVQNKVAKGFLVAVDVQEDFPTTSSPTTYSSSSASDDADTEVENEAGAITDESAVEVEGGDTANPSASRSWGGGSSSSKS